MSDEQVVSIQWSVLMTFAVLPLEAEPLLLNTDH